MLWAHMYVCTWNTCMQDEKEELKTSIYIFTNLISTSIHGTRKSPGQEQEKKSISNHHPGEKEKSFGSKRKKRPTSSDPLKKRKIKGYAVSDQKKTKKPSANPAMLQLLKCSTADNGANYKINIYIYIYIYIYI